MLRRSFKFTLNEGRHLGSILGRLIEGMWIEVWLCSLPITCSLVLLNRDSNSLPPKPFMEGDMCEMLRTLLMCCNRNHFPILLKIMR